MKKLSTIFIAGLLLPLFFSCAGPVAQDIPLPEHPRPDFERPDFINLNGSWLFTFNDAGSVLECGSTDCFDKEITVPFPWGSKLSGVADEADSAWYARSINVPLSWKGKRIFVVVGASDWKTEAWLDGNPLGSHCGGYTPFEFEISDYVRWDEDQKLVLKVDDTYSSSHLYGKQGYGNARGIWQTVYLEARGSRYISSVHFSPDIDNSKVMVDVKLDSSVVSGDMSFELRFKGGQREKVSVGLAPGCSDLSVIVPLKNQHLWTLDDPYLYEVTAILKKGGRTVDAVDSYFGQRKVSAVTVPGKDYKYVALNNEPVYLQLCLDQSYNPDGFYTFPSDDFVRREIELSKNLGLNGNRVHIKVEVPRKLYWADKLGLLIMADVPNYWGEPVPEARMEWEKTMREQVERDFNHPSIFAWVDFNETWGLFTKVDGNKTYLPETQDWVRRMYKLTKRLDPTRLVEDNSACNNDHVETDINSWHGYYAGHTWDSVISEYDRESVVGSTFNYIGGNTVADVPLINSECGNVWGYQGSAGDCDYTWDYHEMINSFRRHLHIGGWLYTEHHDVVNEWNGYVRYDRSIKIDGLDELVPGMAVKDFHSAYYVLADGPVCVDVAAGSTCPVKLEASYTTSADPGKMTLETELVGWTESGEMKTYDTASLPVPFEAWSLVPIAELPVRVPSENGLFLLRMVLKNASGKVLHHNFCLFRVKDAPGNEEFVTFAPDSYSASEWSIARTSVLDGLKVNGFGSGWFEYDVKLPCSASELKGAELMFEASAKQLFGKDINDPKNNISGDYMLGKGTFDPCKSPNSYAMTDETLWPSQLVVSVNGERVGEYNLSDDPADHRGMLSWHSQPYGKWMREAGSYGWLVKMAIPAEILSKAGDSDMLEIRFEVPVDAAGPDKGGLAIYGRDFGRWPLDPTLVLSR